MLQRLADHPVRLSAVERGIVDDGARYLPTRKAFVWKEAGFAVSPAWTPAVERMTMDYRIWWCGPANDRDHLRW